MLELLEWGHLKVDLSESVIILKLKLHFIPVLE